MPRFYNATRGSLAITLTNGESFSVAPKTYVTIDPELGVSSSLIHHLRSGHLVPTLDEPVSADPAPKAPEANDGVVTLGSAPVEQIQRESTEPEVAEPNPDGSLAIPQEELATAAPEENESDLSSNSVSAIDMPQRRRKR